MNQFGAGPSQPASSETLFPGLPTLDLGRLVFVIWKRLRLVIPSAGSFPGLAVLSFFLPFVAMWAALAFMMALPQFFENRACHPSYRETLGRTAHQVLPDEETAADRHEFEGTGEPLFQGTSSPELTQGSGGGRRLFSLRHGVDAPPGRASTEP